MGDLSKFSVHFDFLNLLYLPFILVTLNDMRQHWYSLTDGVLKLPDRALLKRTTIFLLLPCIVFLHESGHYLAALSVGARVLEFHYGFLSGYVKIAPDRTASEFLWIAFAGNLLQILIGLAALCAVPFVRAPHLMALLTYFGLFTIAGTAVFYALLSAAGVYGDWIDIYTSSDRTGVTAIAIFHAAVVLLLAYLCFCHGPRCWFARRTMPDWWEHHKQVEEAARNHPDYATLEALCISWMRAGFPGKAEQVLKQMAALSDRPQIKLLKGRILLIRGSTEKALNCFDELISDPNLNEKGRARLCVEAGDILLHAREFSEALNLFSKGVDLDPLLAEARLFKAIMLNSIGKHSEALDELANASKPEMEWACPDHRCILEAEVERANAGVLEGENRS